MLNQQRRLALFCGKCTLAQALQLLLPWRLQRCAEERRLMELSDEVGSIGTALKVQTTG